MNSKERCLATIKGGAADRVPVFPLLMSFSARHLGINYHKFASDGQALADAQLCVREKFGVDAITACSDAFRVAADLGGEIVYFDDQPPTIRQPLVQSAADLRRLPTPDPTKPQSRMGDRICGTEAMVKAVGSECLVLGWVDMPFAEACSLCGVSQFMMMLYDNPDLAHEILAFLTEIVADFALAQLQVGAPMVGAGDAAASMLSPELYRQFALPYEQEVVYRIHQAAGLVKLHVCGDTTAILPDMINTNADLFNVDHAVDFPLACETFGKAQRCFKGNLDPVADLFQSTPQQCQQLALARIGEAQGLRYMLSPGCEVPGMTSDDVFAAFCAAPQRNEKT